MGYTFTTDANRRRFRLTRTRYFGRTGTPPSIQHVELRYPEPPAFEDRVLGSLIRAFQRDVDPQAHVIGWRRMEAGAAVDAQLTALETLATTIPARTVAEEAWRMSPFTDPDGLDLEDILQLLTAAITADRNTRDGS